MQFKNHLKGYKSNLLARQEFTDSNQQEHRLPTTRPQEWLDIIVPSCNRKITQKTKCSKYFKPGDFKYNRLRPTIKENALPSLVHLDKNSHLISNNGIKNSKTEYLEDPEHITDYFCNECNDVITGGRVTCVQCADYDLCVQCARGTSDGGDHLHHYLLRVPPRRLPEEVQIVLQAIRATLINTEATGELPNNMDEEPDEVQKVQKRVGLGGRLTNNAQVLNHRMKPTVKLEFEAEDGPTNVEISQKYHERKKIKTEPAEDNNQVTESNLQIHNIAIGSQLQSSGNIHKKIKIKPSEENTGVPQLTYGETSVAGLSTSEYDQFDVSNYPQDEFMYPISNIHSTTVENITDYPRNECADEITGFHSMTEKNTDDSQDERKRKRQIHYSSDDGKVEERKRKNREKCKRYREKKKNKVAAVSVSGPLNSDEEKREEERKQKNREKTRRYREKKKNEVAAVSMCGSFDERKRKQKDREKTRRYRENKKNEIEVAAMSMVTADSSGTKMEQTHNAADSQLQSHEHLHKRIKTEPNEKRSEVMESSDEDSSPAEPSMSVTSNESDQPALKLIKPLSESETNNVSQIKKPSFFIKSNCKPVPIEVEEATSDNNTRMMKLQLLAVTPNSDNLQPAFLQKKCFAMPVNTNGTVKRNKEFPVINKTKAGTTIVGRLNQRMTEFVYEAYKNSEYPQKVALANIAKNIVTDPHKQALVLENMQQIADGRLFKSNTNRGTRQLKTYPGKSKS